MVNPVFRQDEQGITIEKIMDENVPGWRGRKADFKTFDDYCNWISDCVRGIVTHESERRDH